MGLNKRSTNAAARGELGSYPLLFSIIINMINYWIRLVNSNDELLQEALKLSINMHENKKYSWISNIYSILDFLGLSAQQVLNKKTNIKKVILSKLCFKYWTNVGKRNYSMITAKTQIRKINWGYIVYLNPILDLSHI